MKNMKPTITIRFGASHDDIAVDGVVLTRHKMTRKDLGFARRVIVGGLEKIGYFTKGGRK